jgi:hypothetical protein
VDQVQKVVVLELEAAKKDMNNTEGRVQKKLNQQNSQADIIIDGLATI